MHTGLHIGYSKLFYEKHKKLSPSIDIQGDPTESFPETSIGHIQVPNFSIPRKLVTHLSTDHSLYLPVQYMVV